VRIAPRFYIWIFVMLDIIFVLFIVTRQWILLRDPQSFNANAGANDNDNEAGAGGGGARVPLIASTGGAGGATIIAYPVPSTGARGGSQNQPGAFIFVAPPASASPAIVPPPAAVGSQYPAALPSEHASAKAPVYRDYEDSSAVVPPPSAPQYPV
jgi:hypothetical protein